MFIYCNIKSIHTPVFENLMVCFDFFIVFNLYIFVKKTLTIFFSMSQQLSQSPNLNLLNNQLNHRLSNTLNIASTSSNQDNSELISSPPKRRRNSSPVWAYVKKAEKDTDKHKCNQFGYSMEWSFKTGASTIAIHLSNVHEITCKESELLQVAKKTESKLYNPDQIKIKTY